MSHDQKLLAAKTASMANATNDAIAAIDIQLVRTGLCISKSLPEGCRNQNGDKYIIY